MTATTYLNGHPVTERERALMNAVAHAESTGTPAGEAFVIYQVALGGSVEDALDGIDQLVVARIASMMRTPESLADAAWVSRYLKADADQLNTEGTKTWLRTLAEEMMLFGRVGTGFILGTYPVGAVRIEYLRLVGGRQRKLVAKNIAHRAASDVPAN